MFSKYQKSGIVRYSNAYCVQIQKFAQQHAIFYLTTLAVFIHRYLIEVDCSFDICVFILQCQSITWIVYAMKQSMAPHQRSNENPPKRVRQNLIHSGTDGGGVRLLRPYFALPSAAASLVKPVSRLVLNLLLNRVKSNKNFVQAPSFCP